MFIRRVTQIEIIQVIHLRNPVILYSILAGRRQGPVIVIDALDLSVEFSLQLGKAAIPASRDILQQRGQHVAGHVGYARRKQRLLPCVIHKPTKCAANARQRLTCPSAFTPQRGIRIGGSHLQSFGPQPVRLAVDIVGIEREVSRRSHIHVKLAVQNPGVGNKQVPGISIVYQVRGQPFPVFDTQRKKRKNSR